MSLDMKFGIYYGLELIANNAHVPKAVRMEAKHFKADQDLASQLSEAVRVATRDPRTWSWPLQVEPRLLWTRHRWRLYPTLSLVELFCLHESSEFWSSSIDGCYSNSAVLISRRSRLQKLLDLEAPEVIMANERRMLKTEKERLQLDWYEPIDPWTDQPVLCANDEDPVTGIVGKRAYRQSDLRDSKRLSYGYDEGVNPMVQLVFAEIELLRAAYPERPLSIVKLDLREFFATVPHATLLAMLRGLGMSADGIEFTERILQIPYGVDSTRTIVAARGVPMEVEYSHWLCEKLTRVLERFIHRQAKVRIIRQIDDLCILGSSADEVVKAYRAAQAFLSDVGLSLNDSKSGAITIGGLHPSELPAANPRWGVLELTAEAQWQVSQEAFEDY